MTLCRLVDRSGCTQELEVNFRIVDMEVVKADEDIGLVIADSLARFRSRGHIRVVWVGSGGNECFVYPHPHPWWNDIGREFRTRESFPGVQVVRRGE